MESVVGDMNLKQVLKPRKGSLKVLLVLFVVLVILTMYSFVGRSYSILAPFPMISQTCGVIDPVCAVEISWLGIIGSLIIWILVYVASSYFFYQKEKKTLSIVKSTFEK
ncbi:hypothetical protein ACFLQ2_02795 [archaeon]